MNSDDKAAIEALTTHLNHSGRAYSNESLRIFERVIAIANRAVQQDETPVESPDDWVTQDVVPDRYGIDQWRWKDYRDGSASIWYDSTQPTLSRKHGALHAGETFEVRCRRKDLPKTEPTVKRIPVRLWILERYLDDKGAAICACVCPPTGEPWREVLSDGNGGWCIEIPSTK